MSRIGKKPISIPDKTEVKVEDKKVIVKGPKGQLEQLLPNKVFVEVNGSEILIKVENETIREQKALWGLFRSLVFNMVEGVVNGFSKQLEINGIGFKAEVSGKNLLLNVGFSHQVVYPIPQGIEISVEKNVITIYGADKQRVGQTAAEIRAIKKPEPYKGKGIKYIDEVIHRKAGKVVKGSD